MITYIFGTTVLNLFLEGFYTDGPKQGKNKYSAQEALAHLANLKLENGRKKYSHDISNRNGPLPSVQYIKAWFHNRKDKMAEVERSRANRARQHGVDDDIPEPENIYASRDKEELERLALRKLEPNKFTPKYFFVKLLENDDFMHAHNRQEQLVYEDSTVEQLKQICKSRMLPSKLGKKALAIFLEQCDEVQKHKSNLLSLKRVILEHEENVEASREVNDNDD